MEPLNNHMDDLYRKAGDNYPLKTSDSDWERVLGKLNEESLGEQQAAGGLNRRENRQKRRWLFLLLLIPLGLSGVIYYYGSGKRTPGTETNEVKNIPALENEEAKTNPEASHEESSPGLNKAGITDKNTGNEESAASESGVDPSGASSPLSDAGPGYSPQAKNITLSVSESKDRINVSGKPLAVTTLPEVSLAKPMSKTMGKPGSEKMKTSRGIYIGFLAGPDLSSVDFQSIKQPGFSLGFIAGYRFNSRLSLETGILWDKKYYYSTGNYFDKSNAGIVINETVLNLNGYCNMFEIPILLRYDFAVKNNHGFFAKTGLSSYLMKKEFYDMNAIYNGNYVSYSKPFYNSTKNILSILQLSAGYEYTISGKTKIQIEPYLKIPLQGIGVGKMPISSAGLYLGISYSFR